MMKSSTHKETLITFSPYFMLSPFLIALASNSMPVDHKEKRGFVFLGSETKKMINCEHVIISMWFHYFFQLHFNKLYPIGNYERNISGT